MGGDFGDGALAGGLAAFSVRGISKAYMSNIADMEQSFMKNMLGDSYANTGTYNYTEDILQKYQRGSKITDLSDEAKASLKVSDVSNYNQGGAGQMKISDYINKSPNTKIKLKKDIDFTYQVQKSKTIDEAEARRINLKSIDALDTKEAKAFIERKGPNRVMAHNRTMTIGGGMLAGVAFTGRSDKRDYRRGFNSHRGNRI